MVLKQASSSVYWTSVDFKGAHYPKSVILYAVYFYVRYGVSYRYLEEILEERGAEVDHATLNRWEIKFSPMIAANAQARKRPSAVSWRMNETYIKVKGRWTYYYRAVDNTGKTLGFMLSERRNKTAARRFFKRAIGTNGVPDRAVIDKSGANLAGLESVNLILKFTGSGSTIKILQVKYLNNIVEQDHRFIKRDCQLVFAYLRGARPLPVRRSFRQHSLSRGREHRTLRGGMRRRRVDSVVGALLHK